MKEQTNLDFPIGSRVRYGQYRATVVTLETAEASEGWVKESGYNPKWVYMCLDLPFLNRRYWTARPEDLTTITPEEPC